MGEQMHSTQQDLFSEGSEASQACSIQHSGDGLPAGKDDDRTRALVEELITDTRLYANSKALKELLCFTARLRCVNRIERLLGLPLPLGEQT